MIFERHVPNSFASVILAAAVAALMAVLPAAAQQGTPAPGTFLGAVLISDNAQAASAFYADLFGWDMEQAKDGGYAVRHKGQMIGGISPLRESSEDVEKSFWLVGLKVEDVDRSLQIATEKKATIHEKVHRISDYGRFGVIADRQGAPLLLIEPGVKALARTKGHGSWLWAELWTDDVEDAAAFYANVIGVGHDTVDRNGGKYQVFTSQNEPRTGIIEIPAELETVEPGWAPYVSVADLESSLARVKKLGGRVIFGEIEHPADGSVALIMDPSGAVLFIYQIGIREEAK
jgi:predicted enzyme related to lactoylglutathione lyase